MSENRNEDYEEFVTKVKRMIDLEDLLKSTDNSRKRSSTFCSRNAEPNLRTAASIALRNGAPRSGSDERLLIGKKESLSFRTSVFFDRNERPFRRALSICAWLLTLSARVPTMIKGALGACISIEVNQNCKKSTKTARSQGTIACSIETLPCQRQPCRFPSQRGKRGAKCKTLLGRRSPKGKALEEEGLSS